MCGIYGVSVAACDKATWDMRNKLLKSLASSSEARGKDSSGVLNISPRGAQMLRGPLPSSALLSSRLAKDALFAQGSESPDTTLGHSRLVTNGSQLTPDNNQPVPVGGVVGIHNGIITNVDDLWARHSFIHRRFDIDTEFIVALADYRMRESGLNLLQAVSSVYREIQGTAAVAMVAPSLDSLVLATNNGSLYTTALNDKIFAFASEGRFLKQALKAASRTSDIVALNAGMARVVDLKTLEYFDTPLCDVDLSQKTENSYNILGLDVTEVNPGDTQLSAVLDLNEFHLQKGAVKEADLLKYPIEKIKELRRCTNCILPETFPFITFSADGVCNYCLEAKTHDVPNSFDNLTDLVAPYKGLGYRPDVLIPLSGGRDSIYTLHVAKEELGLNPITFTYDWGMVTDLARRNVARACGELGVENIIVAADLRRKRENIRKNVTAWLHRPALGMIPLFMAGDKFFFYHAYKIKKSLGIDLEIWGVNRLENTDFKTGFAGVSPRFDKKRIYSLAGSDQLKLFSYVGLNFLASPGYINKSMGDSLGSFFSRFFTPKDHYVHLFDYLKWDEATVEKTIIDQYGWEVAVDTSSTWRIGDGTASFYNYIYTLVAGFSENDTFRSNQIRQGTIKRDDALRLVYEENMPRYNSIKWYLSIINMDYESTIKRINEIPRLY